jgi:hypothetical protein
MAVPCVGLIPGCEEYAAGGKKLQELQIGIPF